jgi:hypothetical protein
MRGAYGEATDVVALLRRPTRAGRVELWLSDELELRRRHGSVNRDDGAFVLKSCNVACGRKGGLRPWGCSMSRVAPTLAAPAPPEASPSDGGVEMEAPAPSPRFADAQAVDDERFVGDSREV